MSYLDSSSTDGTSRIEKRKIPSWMTSGDCCKSPGEKMVDLGAVEEGNEGEVGKQSRGKRKPDPDISMSKGANSSENAATSVSNTSNISRLLEGVVFALSGFVNPERGMLRSWAMEMGAEYQPDWNSNCTLLVCAFPNTPKFRQVQRDCGTIVSKEWIIECYNQKKLIDIDSYIMHAGKPWRKYDFSPDAISDVSSSRKSVKQTQGSHAKPAASALLKSEASSPAVECFLSSDVKKWAVDDFERTIKWLDSLDDKPEPGEMKKVGADGILTCLQDAIDLLEKKQDIGKMPDAWQFVPRVVDELAKLDEKTNQSALVSKVDVLEQAKACKGLYEAELAHLIDGFSTMEKRKANDASSYDSDDTVEMSEGEIERAYDSMAASLPE